MNTIITKDSNQQYNSMVLNYNKEKKALADDMLYTIAALPIDEALANRSTGVEQSFFEIVMMTQTMHLVMQNWNKSYNNSVFTYPEIEQYQNLGSSKVSVTETEKTTRPFINTTPNKIFSNDDEVIPSLNNALNKKYQTITEIRQGVDAFVQSFEQFYIERERHSTWSTNLLRLITLLLKTVMYIKMQYDLCRNDDANFSTLVMLKSYTKPILNGVPKFPTLSRLNGYDFAGWCSHYGFEHSPIEEEQMLTKYNIEDGTWFLRKWTTKWFWNDYGRYTGHNNRVWTYGDFAGEGFYYLTGEKTTNAGGGISYRVRGFFHGFWPPIISNCQLYFEGWVAESHLGAHSASSLDEEFAIQVTTAKKVYTAIWSRTYRI